MEWGDLHLAAKGTIGFDNDLQPEGAFAGVVADPGAVLKILSAPVISSPTVRNFWNPR